MSVHELVQEHRLDVPLEPVFEFFSRPENLAQITPRWLGFEILTPSPVPMHEGALIDYQIRLGPVPQRWRTMITAFEAPHRFVDQQLMGPYSFWHHTHEFEAVEGGTRIHDIVRYQLPFGGLGRLVHQLAVRRQLEGIFEHRRRIIDEVFQRRQR